ncbi:MAG: tRNA pseudouridine synthase Pus10 [Promethearchaeota archaeon]|nr:MAG: tRNA pseudouridine synthase Pus10 [Candidatus Lokiarchaeota archaeon]
MNILEKIKDIYAEKKNICSFCLGRMFSLLGTSTTNIERGKALLLTTLMNAHRKYLSGTHSEREQAINCLKALAQNAHYTPAQKILLKEGIEYEHHAEEHKCYLCHNIFEQLHTFVEPILKEIKDFEFDNFLIGTSLDAKILNKEDSFKAKLNLFEAESFKSHFNREMGKLLSETLKKPSEFNYPDLTIICTLGYDSFSIELLIRSLFIYGRYKKFLRGIPQTRWPCRECQGKGCEHCNNTGKMYETSVEELISPEFCKASLVEESKFHGAGREDIDVKMLGSGRPFVLELINPKKRTLDLDRLKTLINKDNEKKVEIDYLNYSDKNEVIKIKQNAKDTKKTYKALVQVDQEINQEEFEAKLEKLKKTLEGSIVYQKTPQRVAHRRADKVRKKKIFVIEGSYLNPTSLEFIIQTQGGTYIKELISSDQGRTTPSFSEIFEIPLKCEKLDVLSIDY